MNFLPYHDLSADCLGHINGWDFDLFYRVPPRFQLSLQNFCVLELFFFQLPAVLNKFSSFILKKVKFWEFEESLFKIDRNICFYVSLFSSYFENDSEKHFA